MKFTLIIEDADEKGMVKSEILVDPTGEVKEGRNSPALYLFTRVLAYLKLYHGSTLPDRLEAELIKQRGKLN